MAGRILIVDDVATNRIVFKVKLAAACYQPVMASDGMGCLRMAREVQPDLILLDATLPDMPGIEVLRQLRAEPETRNIPVVLVSASTDPALCLAALEAGADDCLIKPIEDAVLMARLRNLLRLHEALAELGQRDETLQTLGLAEAQTGFEAQGSTVIVSDRPELALRWRRETLTLQAGGARIITRAEALSEALAMPGDTPDVFVIDADLGGPGGGLRLMSELRSRSATRHAGVVLLHVTPRPEDMAMAYDMGANLALPAQISGRELTLRLRGVLRRKQLGDRLRASVQDGLRMAVIDPLTGLYNRRYALPRLAAISERAESLEGCFAVMVIDIDRFKSVNDRFGHAGGDAVLVEVAQRLAENLRASDLVARIGGEEFLVALPDIGLTEARSTAERLCALVQERPIHLPDGQSLSVTVSIGLAVSDFGTDRPEEVTQIFDRADRALMIAKAGGRNQVILGASAA
ncbi:MAG: diguanylate cyclase [Gemmobacter sp.]|uniref:diguanylate cyclase n=1 Tax=Gemmobacter sp. TaxID=1898957 RepID=UPI001A63FE9C|nr:diguanylate cyclase [Gemmobacter sp.]MBL8562484.1 diguanylate cyclase [Gemmobacter sp.]